MKVRLFGGPMSGDEIDAPDPLPEELRLLYGECEAVYTRLTENEQKFAGRMPGYEFSALLLIVT